MGIYRQDRTSTGSGLVTDVNNKFLTVLFDLSSFSTNGVEALGVKIWINNRCMTIINVYTPEGRVREPWLQRLTNTVLQPFLILDDFNKKHQYWGSMTNTTGLKEIFNWLIKSLTGMCILNTNRVFWLSLPD